MKLRCLLGHKWKQSRPLTLLDSFPPSFMRYENPTRECSRCGKRQRWLPGYGGSEVGCWMGEQA